MTAAMTWIPRFIPRLRAKPVVHVDQVIVEVARARALADQRAEELHLAARAALEAVDGRARSGLKG